MGQETASRTRVALSALLAALLLLALAATAQAAPTHLRKESLDITALNHACGAAVDSKGDLYASSAGNSKIKVYDASHTLLTEIEDANTPCGLAVTTTGDLYVSEKATGEVVRFKPNKYPFEGTPTYGSREVIDASTKAKGIAVDPIDNRLYVAEGDHVAIYKADGGFEANVGEGTLTEASGVAPYTYSSVGKTRYLWVADPGGLAADKLALFTNLEGKGLALRRELKGTNTPDGSFGFGAAGAYLAADPGNRNSENKCVAVSEQACSAGHLFLYDAAHKALDEFDATGEYLDRTANASFADAEPTAIAIDRSGGSGDGTLYVTAGAGAGAKALAFGPLKAPSRKTLEEPLSHILANARAVATDSHGDVYAAAAGEGLIHVYGPDGKEIVEFEDEANPSDIAVDSVGNVYVFDDKEGFINEAEVTYYEPSSYPPEAGTEYARLEPSIVLVETDFPAKNILKGIAVNPGPGPSKDRLYVASNATTHLYKSAAEGSEPIDEEFAKCVPSINHQSIAVNGANGTVYIGTNASGIYAVDETGKECLGRFDSKGSPSGKTASNPYIGVDQANGHVIEYDGSTSTLHEYDAAGSFVAEFGSFTENIVRLYRVAVDSSCALHNPPLDETTVPTCKAFDPANGNVYVAWDDSNIKHPPYDVNAFGPLKYGAGGEKFSLSVEKSGSGSGKVTSTPAGIDCGSTCSAEFEEGKVVELKAEASGGSEFVKWSGPCSGTGACKVAVSEAKTVTAEFKSLAKAKFKLTVKKTGSGSGKVTSSPAGIDCGSTCSFEYDEGTEVTLSASPEAGSTFSGWSGSGCSGTGTCKVTMSSEKEVTATFTLETHLLSVTKKGTGTGTVTSSPAGINCGSECSFSFDHGTTVTLTGTPGAKTKAVVWSGCGSVNGENKCLVTMTTAKAVTATFDLEPTVKFKLSVIVEGSGSGKVTSSPAAIECPPTCSAEFEEGVKVALTASPNAGSKFAGWGGACSGTGSCEVTMSEAKTVKATFTLETHLLLVTKKGTGTGTVTSSPAGINCGSECSFSFDHGTSVTLTGTPGAKTKAVAWSGCDSVNGENKCLVSMTTAKAVTATFDLEPVAKYPLSVSKTGAGSGTITSSPAGINCGGTCSAEFEEGTEVTLNASAESGSEFRQWSGACSGASTTCKVTISEAKSVGAFFSHAKQTLTLIQKGTGAGTTMSKPKGIKCAATCTLAEARLFKGTAVLLKVKAAMGSSIAGFTGCDTSTQPTETEGTCEVAMSKARTVEVTYGKTAKAILNPKALSFEKATGTGQGTVKAYGGLTCEAACTKTQAYYTSGDGGKKLPALVTLKATATFGSAFSGWEGCESNPTPTECVVTMSTDRTVKAQFTAKALKALTLTRSGGGTVSSKPKGIKCAATCDQAVAALPEGTVVELKAKAASGSKFSSWEGCKVLTQTELESSCEVELSSAKAVKATFTTAAKPLLEPKALTLTKAGSGYGTVKATGLTCEAACTSTEVKYTGGDGGKKLPATVTLKATSQAGSDPVSWMGCESNPTASECVVLMSEAREVIATFEE
jgi:streptogramin lyase